MDKAFQAWWNARYFSSTNPLYATFKKLSELEKIDLDYVDFLCDTLRMGDYLQLLRPKPKVDSKYQLMGKFLRTHGDYLVGLLRRFGALAVGFTAKRITELYFTKEKPLTLSSQEVKRIISETSFVLAGLIANNIENGAKERRAQTLDLTKRLKANSRDTPLIRLIIDYNNPRPLKRGNKADPWGYAFSSCRYRAFTRKKPQTSLRRSR
jgi:hypothetical protein